MYDPSLTPRAKELRRDMTAEERLLWYSFLRNHRPRFYRQRVIDKYIVDFYCSAARLVIELDGAQHYEAAGLARDRIRTYRIEKLGLLVLRIPNNEVRRNLQGVCDYIDSVIKERTAT